MHKDRVDETKSHEMFVSSRCLCYGMVMPRLDATLYICMVLSEFSSLGWEQGCSKVTYADALSEVSWFRFWVQNSVPPFDQSLAGENMFWGIWQAIWKDVINTETWYSETEGPVMGDCKEVGLKGGRLWELVRSRHVHWLGLD